MLICFILIDWTAGNHDVERKMFIERLQQYAREKSIRVSFLGGDVMYMYCLINNTMYTQHLLNIIGALLWCWKIIF